MNICSKNEESSNLEEKIEHLKMELCKAKSQLDKIKHVEHITRNLDPFRKEKYKIAKVIKLDFISNAWLKCFEMIMHFELLKNKKIVRHYDNASFPGAFILATEYIVKNYYNCDYNWRACSLYDPLKPHLEDDYGLYKNNPNKWLMDHKNNGDITKIENINDITKKLLNKTNLFTSDLGFDVSADYNNQEKLHFRANTGQVLLCLKVLQAEGCCIIKHFSYFEKYTLFYLSKFSKLFEKFYFYKPLASKILNSEIYLIGINFIGTSLNHLDKNCPARNLISFLEKKLINGIYDCDFHNYEFPTEFVKLIWDATDINVRRQIKHLNNVLLISQEANLFKSFYRNTIKREISRIAKKYRPLAIATYNDDNILLKIHLKNIIE